MKLARRSKRVFEPPAILLTDLAFNLVIFFVVCASTEPASGRKQDIPRSSKDQSTTATAKNVEIVLTRTTIEVNGTKAARDLDDLTAKLKPMLAGKTRPEERMVVLKSTQDTPYHRWIRVTTLIEQAGGMVALQLEETREEMVK